MRNSVPYVWACFDIVDVNDGMTQLKEAAQAFIAEGIPWSDVPPILRRLHKKNGGTKPAGEAIIAVFRVAYGEAA